MTVWVIAGLLAVATGVRLGWATVHKQSLVSSAMVVALGGLALVAVFTWQPLALLLDDLVRWPNTSAAAAQVALVVCAAGSCVMVTSASSSRPPVVTRRFAAAQYGLAAAVAVATLVHFFSSPRVPEMAPELYLRAAAEAPGTAWGRSVPLLYVVLALSVVAWTGVRFSSRTRRGRALFVFTVGVALLILASTGVVVSAFSAGRWGGVGVAAALFGTAMVVVAAGSLLPTVEDHLGARRDLRTIAPLLHELLRRHPDAGIGIRPRGPLAFRVAERMSLISDALFLEATGAAARTHVSLADAARDADRAEDPSVPPADQAGALARWLASGTDEAFPGLVWLRQPPTHSDREWLLEIARAWNHVASDRAVDDAAVAVGAPEAMVDEPVEVRPARGA